MAGKKEMGEFKMPGYREDVLATVTAMLAPIPGVKPGKAFGQPGFFVGGKMFASAFGEGVAIKLPPDRLAACLEQPHCTPFQPMGRTMGGWALITHEQADEFKADLPWFEELLAFVAPLAK